MIEDQARDRMAIRGEPLQDSANSAEPGLLDGVRLLYRYRLRLLLHFVLLAGAGTLAYLYVLFVAPKILKGTVAVTFRGIEKHEYPNGKKFSVEDFRTPNLLEKASADAGLANLSLDVTRLAAQVFVTPAIPPDIQSRWRKQEKDGVKKEEFLPNEFNIGIQVPGLNDLQRQRLFDAIVKRYQERVKYEQKLSLSFISDYISSYEQLAALYDFWDIPNLFEEHYKSLDYQLRALSEEAQQFQNRKYQLAFLNISKELNTWHATRLQALEALTYHGGLVKNKDIMLQRVQYRLDDTEIQIKQKTAEASEAERLLQIIDRPKAMLAGQLNSEKAVPIVDVSALDKLIMSDYVGPVVDRISKLQQEVQVLAAERSRLQKQLSWLPKASNAEINQLSPHYKELLQTLSSELNAISKEHNTLVDDYLTATVTSLVTVKQTPIVMREGPTLLVLVGIVLMSAFLAILLVSLRHLFRRARLTATSSN